MSDPRTHVESALKHLRSVSSPPPEVRSAIAELDAALQTQTPSSEGPSSGSGSPSPARQATGGAEATGVASGQAGQAELAEVKNPWETA